MRTRVQRWGNSLALRIPKAFATEAGLGDHSAVELTVSDGKLVVTRATERQFTLEQLVDAISPENRHGEIYWGSPVGKEIW